ncbi:hypothetical protein HOD29_06920 [archaeon]|nr:hypothetical protein [archaeon]
MTVEAELEGEKVEFDAITESFDVEAGKSYRKVLNLRVPYELKDEISTDLKLNVEVDGKMHKSDLDEVTLRVQRPTYNAVVKSITTPSSIDAGENFAVEVVLKNMGYNDLDDVYVSARISELGVYYGPKWFGDLVCLEDCDDDCDKEDTVMGELMLSVPYGVEQGIYALEVTVFNDDTETTEVRQVVIRNDFTSEVVTTGTEKEVRVGEDAEFTMLLVNPTDNVKVYKVVSESTDGVSSSTSQTVVVSAGTSKEVTIVASAESEGEYSFNVNVLSGEDLVDTVTYNLDVEGKSWNSTVLLTVILAIIFLVLLVVLIVLIAKKPEKTEDFGESYY